ncbi:MAG: tetratricopeptide repeat protein [Nitrospirae bacterium]|nr:tetratricopeptide repeat protein [Nitrospirota bacterium]
MNRLVKWTGRWWFRDIVILCLFLVIGSAIYKNSIGNPFHYDDQLYIEDNFNIRTLKNIPLFFTHPKTIASNPNKAGHYRPLVVMSHAVDYALGGLNPVSYHLTSLAFHVGSALLIFLILNTMLCRGDQTPSNNSLPDRQNRSRQSDSKVSSNLSRVSNDSKWCFAALAAGLIFLVHPFNSEVVNYLTARSSVMSGFFYLLGFYFWVKYRSEKRSYFYIFSLLAFIAGMLSKEVAITLPVMLWLYDLYGFGQESTSRSVTGSAHVLNWRTCILYLPFVLIVLIPYLIMRLFSFGSFLPHFRAGVTTQIFTELPVLVKYLRLFILPVGLNVDHYAVTYKTFFAGPVMFSAVILILYIITAAFLYRSKALYWRLASFFMIWFFIVLIPTTLFPLNAIFQENRGYLAIVTFAVLAGIILGKIKVTSLPGYLPTAIISILLLIYSIGTVHRNSVWKDGLSLWSDAAAKSPGSARAYSNLGTAYARSGDNEKAVSSFLRALELATPESGIDPLSVHYNLGSVYQQIGRPDLAVSEYMIVTRLDPLDSRPYYNLGVIYQQRGDLPAAIDSYKKVLEKNPADFKSYHNLGLIYQKKGDLVPAAGFYKKVLNINPGYERSRFNLGAIYEMEGNLDAARGEYITVLKLNPEYIQAYYSLGKIYEKEGKMELAVKAYKEAARRNPADTALSGYIRSLEK